MNLVVFASDAKHASYLNSIITEAWDRVNVFYMICDNTQLKNPISHPKSFHINHNISDPKSIWCNSLNCNLPFKPDWLIISRERWDPESRIINEFQNVFQSKIGLVEPNSAFINSVNQFLESESKNRFANVIDVFFDHSNFIKKQRKTLGFKGNIEVVGNPKHDINLNTSEDEIKYLKSYYKIDPNKKKVLFFTLQNKYRYKLFEQFKKFKDSHPEYQYFLKPYPGEPFDPLFYKEYFPQFFIEDVTPILEETHIWGMYNICDIHLGCISSVMYSSFFLNKEVHEFSKEIGSQENLESNFDIINGSSGHEDKLEIWLNTFDIDLENFKNLTHSDKMVSMLKENNKIWNLLEDCVSSNKEILKLYDEFNDNKASKRIIDYIENELH
jgi:hypothetical protein